MSFYWKEYYEKLSNKFPFSPLKQVGKTIDGNEVSIQQIDIITSQISKYLSLKKDDFLIDFGFGNGIITCELSRKVNYIYGTDFSESLINYADQNNFAENLKYINSDITNLNSSILKDATCFSMHEVLQHLPRIEFSNLLRKITNESKGSRFFISGIPNKNKLRLFYDSKSKFEFYLKCEKEKRPHMGKWWDQNEINILAKKLGWKYKFIEQPNDLVNSYYRFNVLLVR